jgi:predicted O-methyltransferase YrrM
MKGKSYDILRNTHVFIPETADYVYIDGSHLAIDVLSDAVLSWSLLKDGGILVFDDYGWGDHTTDEKQKPKLAIDAFLSAYREHYQVLEAGWQVYMKKLHYEPTKEELEANYQ